MLSVFRANSALANVCKTKTVSQENNWQTSFQNNGQGAGRQCRKDSMTLQDVSENGLCGEVLEVDVSSSEEEDDGKKKKSKEGKEV